MLIFVFPGYDFNAHSINTTNQAILTYHRMAEAFKFAYAKRSALGDEEFVNITEVHKASQLCKWHDVIALYHCVVQCCDRQVTLYNYANLSSLWRRFGVNLTLLWLQVSFHSVFETYQARTPFAVILQLMRNLTSDEYAEYTRSRITDDMTHDVEYYDPAFELVEDSGTAHASILAADGSAVSVTGTINL